MSTALTKTNEIKKLLNGDSFRQQVANALPSHLKPERFVRIALTAINKTPKLADCTQQSLFACLLDLSAAGLEPDGRHAHLIPYGSNCTLIVDYKGLVDMAMRSGNISTLHADKVCENDTFEVDRGLIVAHKVGYKEPRGKAYAYYAIARFKDGGEKCEVMTLDEIEAIRKRSRAGNSGPWQTDFDEMAKKTVFRRLSKWLPLSAESRAVIARDEEREFAPIQAAPTPAIELEDKPADETETTPATKEATDEKSE